ncbi:MAG TPA: DUF4238 domain-containing protein [Balneolaceae bacterium]
MSDQETVRQHFVPRVYLKNFSWKDGDKFLIDSAHVDNPSNSFTPNIKDICVKNDFYTLSGGTEDERQLIENFYRNVEEDYDVIYSNLVDTSVEEIESKEKQTIIAFITTLLFRNLSWVEKYNKFVEKTFKNAHELCQHNGTEKFKYLGKTISFENRDFDQVISDHLASLKEDQVTIQVDIAVRLANLRSKNNIFVTELGHEETNFITSDNPVVIHSDKKGFIMPGDPNNTLSLPLDNKFMLYLMPSSAFPFSAETNRILRDKKEGIICQTEKLTANFLQIKNAERFLLGTKSDIDKSIEQKRINDETKDYQKPKNLADFASLAKEIGLID